MPAPEPGQTWGILGGAFDPVHLGHLALAGDVLKIKALDGILLVPTFDPPHRPSEPHASFEDRLAMLDLAAADYPRFAVSRIEETTGRPSYTLDTVRALKKNHPEVGFSFLIGADNLSQLPTWHRWEAVLEEIGLLVGCRPGADLEVIAGLSRLRVDLVETSLLDISSTGVRTTVGQGTTLEALSAMVPDAVARYIMDRKLYQ